MSGQGRNEARQDNFSIFPAWALIGLIALDLAKVVDSFFSEKIE